MRHLASASLAPIVAVVLAACGSTPAGGTTHTSSSTTTTTTTKGTGGAGGTGGSTGGTSSTGGMATTGGAGGSSDAGTGGSSDAGTGGSSDAGTVDASLDAGPACMVGCTPGECILVSACAALPGHSSTPGYCPGAADIECCTVGGSVSDNPPVPTGWMLMTQAQVTPAMTTWAVAILNDPTDYPMFSTAMMTFGTQLVMARVEWHPPDFQNCAIHRGVTLYVPG